MKFKFFYHPGLAANLIACVDVIRGMAVQRALTDWVEYDRKFCERMIFWKPVRSLGFIDEVLRAIPLMVAAKLAKSPDRQYCHDCGDPSHYLLHSHYRAILFVLSQVLWQLKKGLDPC